MDIPIHLWVLGLAIILLLAFMITGTEHTVPMYVKSRFDDACSSYLAKIEKDGGLDSTSRNMLTAELNTLGVANISITAPESTAWGEEVELRVEGDYVFEATNYASLSKDTKSKRIRYSNKTRSLCLD